MTEEKLEKANSLLKDIKRLERKIANWETHSKIRIELLDKVGNLTHREDFEDSTIAREITTLVLTQATFTLIQLEKQFNEL